MRQFGNLIHFVCIIVLLSLGHRTFAKSIEVQFPEWSVAGVSSEINVTGVESNSPISIQISNQESKILHVDENGNIPFKIEEPSQVTVVIADQTFSKQISPIPLWMSILPPLLAIFLALLLREVVISLVVGLLIGTITIQIYAHGAIGFILGFARTIDTYILNSLNDGGHLSIIVFSMLIGSMVKLITLNGGMSAIVARLSKKAQTAKSGQFVTWLLGVLIFFDDYANTLIVGNTMRPVTDRLKISREKLSYIVDSTAAPIAALAFVTTWIGAELGYIADGVSKIDEISSGAYAVFLQSLPYSFYPIMTLLFIVMIIYTGRDYGPMLKAELKARKEGLKEVNESESSTTAKGKMFNAIIPVSIIVLGTILGLIITGVQALEGDISHLGFWAKASAIIGGSDSYVALLWSSFASVIVAVLLTAGQKIMSVHQSIEAVIDGCKTMLNAVVILVLAWSMAMITEHLHTADYLIQLASDQVNPMFFPLVTFVLSALVAFSTGSSWGTMAILYPILLPASWILAKNTGLSTAEILPLFFNTVSCVIAGSVLGDHCSPISDTTILSSMASSCNHIEHVRTQMPYALTVGVVAMLCGTLLSAMGVPIILCYVLGLTVLWLIVKRGKVIE